MSAAGDEPPLPRDTPADSQQRAGSEFGRLFVVLILFGLLLGTCLYSPAALENLLLGWIYFPLNQIPRVTLDWPSVIVGMLATLFFLVTLHGTLRWAGRTLFVESTPPDFPRFRTTLACGLGLLLLFAAGVAMVGATHQVAWLVTSDAPRSTEVSEGWSLSGFIARERDFARRSQMRNSLKQTGLAMHGVYDYANELPPGGTIDRRGRLLHGWAIHLGSYASYSYAGIDFQTPWNEAPNAEKFRCAVPDYLNPAIPEVFDREGYGLAHVAGNVHVLPITRVDPPARPSTSGLPDPWALLNAARDAPDSARRDLPLRFSNITDGTANTLLIGQSAGNFKPWGHPTNVREPALGLGTSPDGFGGTPGSGSCLFLMCDGATRSINQNVDRSVLKALATPRGKEDVELPVD